MEVFYGGLWGTVGASKWDLTDALVLCRQLGFTKTHGTYNKKPKGKRVIWFSDFQCQGSEPTLGQCKHNLLARAFSSYDEPLDVFARCGEDMESKAGLSIAHNLYFISKCEIICHKVMRYLLELKA